MRRAALVRVDIVDVVRDARGVERRLVVVEVLRPGDRRGIGLHPGVVLVGEDQQRLGRLDDRLVGEVFRRGRARGEPHLDRVAGLRADDEAAHAVVVDAGVLVVVLAAGVLRRRHDLRRTAVDLEVHGDRAELALDDGADGLRIAVGLRELVDGEVLGGVVEMRVGLGRVVGGLREVQRERQVAQELLLDLLRRVGELEARHVRVLGDRALGRERQRALDVVGPVGEVAVGDVQAGRELGQEAWDPWRERVAGKGGEDLVVGGLRVLLEALRVQQQLGGGVVVLLEERVDLVEERLHRRGLGL